MRLERATIAQWQGASEDQEFVAQPTQLNMNLFSANGIIHIGIHFLRNFPKAGIPDFGDAAETKGVGAREGKNPKNELRCV